MRECRRYQKLNKLLKFLHVHFLTKKKVQATNISNKIFLFKKEKINIHEKGNFVILQHKLVQNRL